MSEAEIPVLIANGDNDYILREGDNSVWITVDELSVYILRTKAGVRVDIYPIGDEMTEPIRSTWALFGEESGSPVIQATLSGVGHEYSATATLLNAETKAVLFIATSGSLGAAMGECRRFAEKSNIQIIKSTSVN